MLVALTISAIGVLLIFWGWRGRIRVIPPSCRACGYELGLRDPRICPECGADLEGIRGIQRRKRFRKRIPLVAGLVLALSGLSWMGLALYLGVQQQTIASTLPTWALIRVPAFGVTEEIQEEMITRARRGGANPGDVSHLARWVAAHPREHVAPEIARILASGGVLNGAELRTLLQTMLEQVEGSQEDQRKVWAAEFERVAVQGGASEDQIKRYAKAAFVPSVWAGAKKVSQGQILPVLLHENPRVGVSSMLRLGVVNVGCEGGEALPVGEAASQESGSFPSVCAFVRVTAPHASASVTVRATAIRALGAMSGVALATWTLPLSFECTSPEGGYAERRLRARLYETVVVASVRSDPISSMEKPVVLVTNWLRPSAEPRVAMDFPPTWGSAFAWGPCTSIAYGYDRTGLVCSVAVFANGSWDWVGEGCLSIPFEDIRELRRELRDHRPSNEDERPGAATDGLPAVIPPPRGMVRVLLRVHQVMFSETDSIDIAHPVDVLFEAVPIEPP